MIRMALDEFDGFEPGTFLMARQENLETIHQHNVVAERYGLLGEIAAEVRTGKQGPGHMTMRNWLQGTSSGA
jgi:GTP cyclohydrolase I/GTP cyclohydrolase-4